MMPSRHLGKIIGAHQPNEACTDKPGVQFGKCFCGVPGFQRSLDIGHDDPWMICKVGRLM